ncbi:MAG: hypothetical protein PF693_02510 [Spirochaetia bacterium]|nr:hypothetical protein [Spirochaetia bacterium]
MIKLLKKIFLILILLLIIISCKKEHQSFQADDYEYTNSFSKGPISLEMMLDKIEINTSENIQIILKGKASDGWKPSFPDMTETLDKFTLVSVSETVPRIEDDGSIGINRTIVLKPFLSGEYEIPRLSLDYSNEHENKGVLLSSPVSINVTSLLPENTDNLQLKEIMEPDTYNYWKLVLYISIAVIIVGGVFLVLFSIRKRKRGKLILGIPPSEEAFTKLTLLLDKKLPEEGKYKEFYFQLNLIVRIYIERQFAIRAPEQTTEEFLQDLAISNEISDEFKQVLKDFLIHSDLVKFALLKPGEEELTGSVESCKNFIKVTGEMS